MLEEHAKLLAVLKSAGEIAGRKKLQKMIYIAKKLNYPFHEKYDFHFYGPYSEEVTLKMEELTNLGLVIETEEKVKGYVQYRYALSEEGNRFLANYNVALPKLSSCVHLLNQQSSRFLELVATMLYFEHLPKEKMLQKVAVVKEKQLYTDGEIEDALQFIERLQAFIQ